MLLQGYHVTLHHLDGSILDSQWIDQIWEMVISEPNLSCWTYLPYAEFKTKEQLCESLNHQFNFNGSFHYLIEVEQRMVGWVALLNQRSEHRCIEIGNVYFSHAMKQSTASTEVIYLLLKACFDQGFRRVEWKCDDFNEPSKQAALRYGFSFEGVFRQDRITKGRNRNTAWFSMLDEEWCVLEKAYNEWLSVDNFDQYGQQKLKLIDFQKLYLSQKQALQIE